MSKGNYLTSLLRSPKTVFTTRDIALMWHESVSSAARVRLNYFVKKGDLYRIRKGIYAKNENYDRLELATRILVPSYVSFETVLVKEGLIFQYYEPIFAASYVTREIIVDGQKYSYRRIKYQALINSIGVEHTGETSVAGKERAFLDILYTNADYHFDNLRSVNWDKVFEILPIYQNQEMASRVNRIFKMAQS